MEQSMLSPVKQQEFEGAAIFQALLERQKFISNHLSNGGTIKELKQMGLEFGKVDLRHSVSARD